MSSSPVLRGGYWKEWTVESAVDPEIVALNVQRLEGHQALEHLLYSDKLPRRNTGILTNHWLTRYSHVEHGGWWCNGIDLHTGSDSLWGCFKPDKPRRDRENKKLIKYEHPPRTETGLFALKIPLHIWQKIASRNGVEMPSDPENCSFWQWVIEHPEVDLSIGEGVKKAGALLTAGHCAVALPGIFNGYRQKKDDNGVKIGLPTLIPELKILAAAGRRINFVFDQDDKQKTIGFVNTSISTTGKLLQNEGCDVFVVTWDSKLGKGCDDLIVNSGPEAFEQAYNAAKTLDSWKARTYSQLTYKPHVRLNQRYLGDLNLPANAKIVGIKAPKGTGKTESLINIVADAHANGQPVLVITHRVQLGQALCQRFGMPYISEIKESELGKTLGYGLCIDSLHRQSQARFEPECWDDALIIIDEVEQVLWHSLNASTCQSKRVVILKTLKTLIQTALAGEGRLIVADADLSDTSLNYLIRLSGQQIQPYIVQNDWKPGEEYQWLVQSYTSPNPSNLIAEIEQELDGGGKPFILCSGQKAKSRWGTQILEAYFSEKYPDRKILRIDSESIAEPSHPAYGCVSDLNEVLHNYDLVIASPSIETGVSIDIRGHFTSVFCIAQGVQAVNSVCQMLARVRENIPRFLWARERGQGIAGGSTSVASLRASQQKVAKANIHQLMLAAFDDELSPDFQPESLDCWAKMAVRINAGMIDYRASILEALREEGHLILEDPDDEPNEEIAKSIGLTRDEAYAQERTEIASAKDLTDAEARKLKDQRAKTREQRHQERKHILKERYGVDVNPNLIEQDDKNWYPQLRLHYYLTLGRTHLSERDKRAASAQLEHGEGDIWLPTFNKSQLGLAIASLERLGIPSLLTAGGELRNSDEKLQTLAELAKSNPWQIKAILGISIHSDDTPLTVLQKLLTKIGIKLRCIRREGGDGNRQRVYEIARPVDGRDEIFQRWLERDESFDSKSDGENSASTSTAANKYIYTGGGRGQSAAVG